MYMVKALDIRVHLRLQLSRSATPLLTLWPWQCLECSFTASQLPRALHPRASRPFCLEFVSDNFQDVTSVLGTAGSLTFPACQAENVLCVTLHVRSAVCVPGECAPA